MSYKETQRELKAPDDFQKLGQQALPWVEQNRQMLTMVVGGLLVVGAGLAIAREVSSRGESKASTALAGSLRLMAREVNETGVAPPEGGDAPFKSEKEKDEALITQLTEFRAGHAGKMPAVYAALPLGQALIRQGKYAEGQAAVEDFLAKAPLNDVLRPAAYEARAYALEMQNKYDEAMSAFDQLAKENSTDFLKGMGLYHRGRVMMLKGDKEGAAKQFVDVDTAAPGTFASRLAKERIALLTEQGVKVPTPPSAQVPAIIFDAGQ